MPTEHPRPTAQHWRQRMPISTETAVHPVFNPPCQLSHSDR